VDGTAYAGVFAYIWISLREGMMDVALLKQMKKQKRKK